MIEIAIGAAVAVGALIWAFLRGASHSDTKQRAKERDAYERHLDEISDAHDARNRVGRVPANDDPYRRD